MRFGVGWINTWDAGRTQTQVLDDFVKLSIAAEELGFWSVSITEHHMRNQSSLRPFGSADFPPAYDLCTDTLSLLSYVAAKTTRLRLQTSLVIAHYDHPVRIAERAAMLDNLSHGRLEFGIGQGGSQGWREPIIYQIPSDPAAKQRKMMETLEIISKVWSAEEFEHNGEFFKLPPGQYVPTPEFDLMNRSMVGSGTPESLQWAARNGWGYSFGGLAQGYAGLDAAVQVDRVWRTAAIEAGKDPATMLSPQHILTYCGENDQDAAETARPYIMEFSKAATAHANKVRSGAGNGVAIDELTGRQLQPEKHEGIGVGGVSITMGSASSTLDELRQRTQKRIDEQIFGAPETCIEKVKFFTEKIENLDYIMLTSGWGGIPADTVIKSLERFAKYVMPEFKVETPSVAR